MPVPPGFVVTTACFDEFIREAGVAADITRLLDDLDAEDIREVDRVSAILREELCSRPVPATARQAVLDAYAELMETCGGEVPVAIRSSATAEDLPDCFEVSATGGGVIMGIRHRELPAEGLQFHPESVLTESGMQMLERFLTVA